MRVTIRRRDGANEFKVIPSVDENARCPSCVAVETIPKAGPFRYNAEPNSTLLRA